MQQGDQVIMNPAVAQQMPVYNMLNTKYFIVQANNPGGAVLNRSACGNAWFVETIQKVGTADEEMAALAQFDPNSTGHRKCSVRKPHCTATTSASQPMPRFN